MDILSGRTIGFASFFFSLASFPSSALALTSLFFLHPARAPINAIEVTFSLGLVQRPDASPFKKVILFFFLSLSVSHAHPSRCVDCCFLFYPTPTTSLRRRVKGRRSQTGGTDLVPMGTRQSRPFVRL